MPCLFWLLRSRVRKFRRDLWITLYFSTLPHKRHNFRKKVTEHKMCVSSFSTNFVRNVFHCEKNWGKYDGKCVLVFMYINCYSFPILMKIEFLLLSWEKSSYIKISWKSFQWEPSCSMRTDRRRDMTKLIVAFHNFSKEPKIYTLGTTVLVCPGDLCNFCPGLSCKQNHTKYKPCKFDVILTVHRR